MYRRRKHISGSMVENALYPLDWLVALALKRQGGLAVKWEQEVRLLQEMIADLPAVEEGQDISPNPLFGKLRHTKAPKPRQSCG